jgi:uncharacterized protein YcfJ
MRIRLGLTLVFAFAVSLSACETPQQQTGTLAGGAIGAGAGALVGSAVSGGSAGGAVAGAVIGGGAGALVGNHATRPRHCAHWGFDRYGNRVCVAWR